MILMWQFLLLAVLLAALNALVAALFFRFGQLTVLAQAQRLESRLADLYVDPSNSELLQNLNQTLENSRLAFQQSMAKLAMEQASSGERIAGCVRAVSEQITASDFARSVMRERSTIPKGEEQVGTDTPVTLGPQVKENPRVTRAGIPDDLTRSTV